MVRGRTCSYVNLKLQVELTAMLHVNTNTYVLCMLSRLGYIVTNMAKAESVPPAQMAYLTSLHTYSAAD